MISVIIPAHNEEKVISATLQELVEGAISGELEVIVVCNGCTDNTARIVASFGQAIRCLETETPSKANALNLGDAAASGFPRFYQDADVILTLDAIRQIALILQSSRFLAAAPHMAMDFGKASWPVRAYYEVWQQLPYVREGMIGVGVYALSGEGRKRFEKFPAIIADDRFIRALFNEQERTRVASCVSVVRAPANLVSLVKIKTRSRLGGYEFEEKFSELLGNERKDYGSAIFAFLQKINLYPALLVYLLVNLWCRSRARWQLHYNRVDVWERDETSRSV